MDLDKALQDVASHVNAGEYTAAINRLRDLDRWCGTDGDPMPRRKLAVVDDPA